MKWIFPQTGIIALLLICHVPLFAKNTIESQPISISQANWFATLGAGAQFPDWHNSMSVDNGSNLLAPNNKDKYSLKDQNAAVITAAFGRRWIRDSKWIPSYSLGIFWQYFFQTNVGDTITQYSNPSFTNYRYNWDISSNLLLASAKLNLFQYKMLSPYLNGGIGSSFNRTTNYYETALSGITPRVSPGFRSANSSQFACNVGVGMDLQYNPQLIVSVGYIYQYLGQINSGAGRDMWSSQSLNPGTYHSNEVLVTLSYLFNK